MFNVECSILGLHSLIRTTIRHDLVSWASYGVKQAEIQSIGYFNAQRPIPLSAYA